MEDVSGMDSRVHSCVLFQDAVERAAIENVPHSLTREKRRCALHIISNSIDKLPATAEIRKGEG